jgi:hypothetical protein
LHIQTIAALPPLKREHFIGGRTDGQPLKKYAGHREAPLPEKMHHAGHRQRINSETPPREAGATTATKTAKLLISWFDPAIIKSLDIVVEMQSTYNE